MRTSPELWVTIRAELFTHLRVMLLFFSWAICMIAFFMWMIYAAMPNPKTDLRFGFAETLETFRKNFGTSRDADLLPPRCLSNESNAPTGQRGSIATASDRVGQRC